MKHELILSAAACLMLGACSDEGAQQAAGNGAGETPTTLEAGQYQLSWKVDTLRSTDNTTPATKLKVGDVATTMACVAADGSLAPEMVANAGDSCVSAGSYVRNGRISVQLNCTNPGGQVTQMVDGDFAAADAFTAKVTTSTYYTGSGDYELTRSVTAKRTGACAPAPAPGPPPADAKG